MTPPTVRRIAVAAACAAAINCSKAASSSSSPATPAGVKAFLDTANDTTLKLGIEAGRAGWVQQTYITDDTEGSGHAGRKRDDHARHAR